MQISFDTREASPQEMRHIARFIATLAGLTISEAKPVVPSAATPAIAQADIPSAGLDTAQMFGQGLPTSNLPPVAAPAGLAPVNVTHLPEVAAPAAPVQVPPVTGIERDAEGLPWDARIHASTKTKTAKGVWTSKRGMNDAAFVQKVKAEIGATLPAAAPQATIPAPVFAPPTPPAQPALALVPPAVTPAPAAPAASFTLPPVALPPAPVAAPQTLGELMAAAGPLMATGQIAPDALQAAATAIGVPQLAMLATASRPDLIEAIWKRLQPSAG